MKVSKIKDYDHYSAGQGRSLPMRLDLIVCVGLLIIYLTSLRNLDELGSYCKSEMRCVADIE